jgi:hypothetical protein
MVLAFGSAIGAAIAVKAKRVEMTRMMVLRYMLIDGLVEEVLSFGSRSWLE